MNMTIEKLEAATATGTLKKITALYRERQVNREIIEPYEGEHGKGFKVTRAVSFSSAHNQITHYLFQNLPSKRGPKFHN